MRLFLNPSIATRVRQALGLSTPRPVEGLSILGNSFEIRTDSEPWDFQSKASSVPATPRLEARVVE